MLDAIVYIYNENLDNLVNIGGKKAVKISNGFISRNTGLKIDLVKRQIQRIEETGLITAIKKGQGNTRHYIVHDYRINLYIEALTTEFQEWFDKSLNTSKTDSSRSAEADRVKLEESDKYFTNLIQNLDNPLKPAVGLVQNPPTKNGKTQDPNIAKPTVVDTIKKTKEDTTTDSNTRVTDEFFKKKNDIGRYIEVDIGGYMCKIYLKEYYVLIDSHPEEDIDHIVERIYSESVDFNIKEIDEDVGNSLSNSIPTNSILPLKVSKEEFLIEILNKIDSFKRIEKRLMDKELKTTTKPADEDISEKNWNRLEIAYDNLQPMENQGKFFVSKKIKSLFFNLSEFRQKFVISRVEENNESLKTTSRPEIYIKEAMRDDLYKTFNSPIPLRRII